MTMLFYTDAEGHATSATLLDGDGHPVEGYTGITAKDGLEYLIAHDFIEVQVQDMGDTKDDGLN